ncbi:chemotaxis protein [Oceanobacillus sp. 143]|uniref:Chemotaxis protein n=1 Tax=Oceanobacillus zhaokaii TaxID=2052660 RepID=A0A345PJE5_9BACI|nr:chemotaxis protein [Oceanobacillus zhaokaii]AXI10125.1 chemotaxis protein [Oceanobacillus zhaokaii]QGS69249.1 chemotaxis protein [Oceanobacillus sp. 143]
MTQKIAIAILHGMGTPKEDFAEEIMKRISKRFAKKLPFENAENELVFEPVFWSQIFEPKQTELWSKMQLSADLDFPRLRRFVIEFLGDAIAYQPTMFGNQNYDKVHAYVAAAINRLREKAGPDAPLCVISHSLGTIVASNYFYDLQYKRENRGVQTRRRMDYTPIEQCETLTLFYTLGSPMVLWSLRYTDFGSPITIPSPKISNFYPNVKGEWLNFYDKDDVLAYPLKGMNEAYNQAVTKDLAVNAGGIFTSWSPLSHRDYERENEVIDPIVDGLVRTWRSINE